MKKSSQSKLERNGVGEPKEGMKKLWAWQKRGGRLCKTGNKYSRVREKKGGGKMKQGGRYLGRREIAAGTWDVGKNRDRQKGGYLKGRYKTRKTGE